jgi:hypothetical protein
MRRSIRELRVFCTHCVFSSSSFRADRSRERSSDCSSGPSARASSSRRVSQSPLPETAEATVLITSLNREPKLSPSWSGVGFSSRQRLARSAAAAGSRAAPVAQPTGSDGSKSLHEDAPRDDDDDDEEDLEEE